jgi:hypothetical protein
VRLDLPEVVVGVPLVVRAGNGESMFPVDLLDSLTVESLAQFRDASAATLARFRKKWWATIGPPPHDLAAAQTELTSRLKDGVYRDAMVSFNLPRTGEPMAGLENLDTAREQLADYKDTLKRWKDSLAAIEQRERSVL